MEALPAPYGRALTLAADGLDHGAIAAQIDVPLDAVATLLEVGQLKLAALLAEDAGADHAPEETEAPLQSSESAAGSARESEPSM